MFEKFNQNVDKNTRPVSRDQLMEHTHFLLRDMDNPITGDVPASG